MSKVQQFIFLAISVVLAVMLSMFPFSKAGADRFDEQIRKLETENQEHKSLVESLLSEAKSLEDAINQMQNQINALQSQITANESKSKQLKLEIAAAEAELEKQRAVLGENIRKMYVEGEISTLEMLATSKDLSQFVDKQQYRNVVADKIKAQLDSIEALKKKLSEQRTEVERLIKEDKQLRSQIAAQKAERNRLLNLNREEQAAFNAKIAENQNEIKDLKHQQYLETVRKYGNGGGQAGSGDYPWSQVPCMHGGHIRGYCDGYEWSSNGDWHNWANGGYAYRNCTDYVAWRTGAPGGLGDAKEWHVNAPAYGYATGRAPKPGAAAVDKYLSSYGHVMYVESVNSDGSVLLSDYNRAAPGEYGTLTLSAQEAAELYYVYF